MAIIANTLLTFSEVGMRESLSDVISNISPTDTPVLSGAKKGKAKQTFNEFQTDSLAAAVSTNAQLEGDDLGSSYSAATLPTRVGNYQQISRKTVILADSVAEVDLAGRNSEMAYQIMKRGKEIKRDQETSILANQAGIAGNGTTARQTAGLLAWIKSNVTSTLSTNTPSYTSVPNATRTDGAARTFTEALLQSCIQLVWASGAEPDTILVSAKNKVVVSAFAGVATKTAPQSLQKQAVIVGAADVYVSDFGTYTVVPDHFQRDKDVFLLDFNYVAIDYLRNYRVEDMAKTGDATKKMMLVEWGTRVNNEAAMGLIADCGL